ncbi:hypothetical protein TNCV_4739831 [Trichonephila clavipes]|nr:hypothetical protein TNCV_4739831 [Trichonephila clavipes]
MPDENQSWHTCVRKHCPVVRESTGASFAPIFNLQEGGGSSELSDDMNVKCPFILPFLETTLLVLHLGNYPVGLNKAAVAKWLWSRTHGRRFAGLSRGGTEDAP